MLHAGGLVAFGVADAGSKFSNIGCPIQRNEDETVVVAQHEVLCTDGMGAADGGSERLCFLCVQSLGAGRQGAQAEHGQANGFKLLGVAVQAPDHDATQACVCCLQRHKVTDTGFVLSPAVVNDYHIPWG